MNNNGNGHPRKWEPPNSHSTGPVQRLTVDRGFNADPLKPKMHRVLVRVDGDKWQILGDTASTPIELLRAEVARDHAISMQGQDVMIVDEQNVAVEAFHNYKPVPQDAIGDISEENARIRERWLQSLILWAIPREIAEAPASPETMEKIREALIEAKMEVAIRPDGRAAVVYRNGEVLATWKC